MDLLSDKEILFVALSVTLAAEGAAVVLMLPFSAKLPATVKDTAPATLSPLALTARFRAFEKASELTLLA